MTDDRPEMLLTESSLAISEALWQRLAPLLAAAEPELEPAFARALVDALLYRVLTGSSWAQLPAVAPEQAEATYRRWQDSGLLEQLAQVLRIRLDEN